MAWFLSATMRRSVGRAAPQACSVVVGHVVGQVQAERMTTTGPVVERPYIVSLADRTRGGQRIASLYKTEKVFGQARTRGNSNNCPSHRTGADSLASGQASFYESGKFFGQRQGGDADNKRARRTTASNVVAPWLARPDDNSWACRRTASNVVAGTQAEGMTTNRLVVRNPESLRPCGDRGGRQQPASSYDSDTSSRPDASWLADNKWPDCHSCEILSGSGAPCRRVGLA